jgi:hypothetical protein
MLKASVNLRKVASSSIFQVITDGTVEGPAGTPQSGTFAFLSIENDTGFL